MEHSFLIVRKERQKRTCDFSERKEEWRGSDNDIHQMLIIYFTGRKKERKQEREEDKKKNECKKEVKKVYFGNLL